MNKALFILALCVFFFAACSSNSGGPAVTNDATPAGGCTVDQDCEDGFNCTINTCVGGRCSTKLGLTYGPTVCPPAMFCLVTKGCVSSNKKCAKDADCTSDDPCIVYGRCDPASSVCVYQALDKDRDGHPPIVCGGDDCDDGNPLINPGAKEDCDGKDQDCDGVVDNGATCSDSTKQCSAGRCDCKPEYKCDSGSTGCTDLLTSNLHCGACGNYCGEYGKCKEGKCNCIVGTTLCGTRCADLDTDKANCGACGNACASDSSCTAKLCTTMTCQNCTDVFCNTEVSDCWTSGGTYCKEMVSCLKSCTISSDPPGCRTSCKKLDSGPLAIALIKCATEKCPTACSFK